MELTVNNRARLKKQQTLANINTDTMEDVPEKDKEADNNTMNDETKEVKDNKKEGGETGEKKDEEANF